MDKNYKGHTTFTADFPVDEFASCPLFFSNKLATAKDTYGQISFLSPSMKLFTEPHLFFIHYLTPKEQMSFPICLFSDAGI